MTTPRQVVLFLAVLALFSAREVPNAQSQVLVFRNATVIDGTGAAAQPGVTVVVTGNRITDVGPNVRVPEQAQVVDATGKFLLPGLSDMHVHLRGETSLLDVQTYGELLFLAHGVTSVRVMAGLPVYHTMQREIDAGRSLGPRLTISSRMMDGSMPNLLLPAAPGDAAGEEEEWRAVDAGTSIPRGYQVTTDEQAREVVVREKANGVEFVKIHNELTPETYFALAEEARVQGLYLAGHVPTGVSVATLSDSGMRSLEHFEGMLEGCSTREDELLEASLDALSLPPAERARRDVEIRRMAVDSFSAEKCAALAVRFVRNETWLSPTFRSDEGIRALSARYADMVKYIPDPLRALWRQQAAAATDTPPPSPEEQELASLVEARTREIVAIMKRGGVQFVSGTDAGGGWRIPGITLHEALVELNEAGLTPMEVIQAATSSPARLLRKDDELGTVQAGMLADLVLLNADPLERIGNTRAINSVVINGRLLNRTMLDEMLARLAVANAL